MGELGIHPTGQGFVVEISRCTYIVNHDGTGWQRVGEGVVGGGSTHVGKGEVGEGWTENTHGGPVRAIFLPSFSPSLPCCNGPVQPYSSQPYRPVAFKPTPFYFSYLQYLDKPTHGVPD